MRHRELVARPACEARADELGRALAGRYDIVALAEVWDEDAKRAVRAGWAGRPVTTTVGARPSLLPPAMKGSGLMTVVDGHPVVRSAVHTFRQRGAYGRDADAGANKGVLLTEVDVGAAGNLEVYSTHLIAGNDFFRKRPGGPAGANADIRQQQVEELVAFVEATHRPGNVALVVGDLNTPASDPAEDDPVAQYQALAGVMDAAGFDDLWLTHGSGPGFTSWRGRSAASAGPTRRPPTSVPSPPSRPPTIGSTRIDHAWLQRPAGAHRADVAVEAFRRRSFPRVPGTDGYEALPFLSDHLALHLELTVTSR